MSSTNVTAPHYNPRYKSYDNKPPPPPPKTHATGWLVIAIIIIVLAIIFSWLFISMTSDTVGANVVQRCNPSVCKFNTITGQKTCPAPGDTLGIQVELGAEFCSSRDYCQQPGFQCAVQPDQTVLCNGVCNNPAGFTGNEQCSCTSNPQLP